MMRLQPALLVAALLLPLIPTPAIAAPGDTQAGTGTSSAQVVDPGALTRLADLRFGAMISPTAAATMTVATDNSVTATGEVALTMNTFASPGGRGPARFRVQGTRNRTFVPFHPNKVTISNGTSTMLVDKLEDNINGNGRLDRNGQFEYRIGGRLNVGANQERGRYRGEFEISVFFN